MDDRVGKQGAVKHDHNHNFYSEVRPLTLPDPRDRAHVTIMQHVYVQEQNQADDIFNPAPSLYKERVNLWTTVRVSSILHLFLHVTCDSNSKRNWRKLLDILRNDRDFSSRIMNLTIQKRWSSTTYSTKRMVKILTKALIIIQL